VAFEVLGRRRAAQGATGSPSLEDVFARATEQEDYAIVAKDILSVMQDV